MKGKKFCYFFNGPEHFRRFLWGLVFLTFFTAIGVIFVPQVEAQTTFSCNSGLATGNLFTQDTIGTTLSDQNGNVYPVSTNGVTNDDPFGNACVSTSTNDLGTFGLVLCFFKSTVGQIVSTLYCQFQYNLLGPLSIALELFVAVAGIMIITGMTRFSAKEGIMMLLKFALVWTFATNATWGIGIAYSFFINIAEQGSNIVLSTIHINYTPNAANAAGQAMFGQQSVSGGQVLSHPDQVISALIGGGNGASGLLPPTLTPYCLSVLIGLLMMLLLFLPWAAGIVLALIIQYIFIFNRALVGYLTALVLVSFLFVLSPLFICFALFKITYPMFEQWLKYIIAFSLQMIMVFGFIAMLTMVPMGAFFTEILSLVRPYDVTKQPGTAVITDHFCSICPYAINNNPAISPTTPLPNVVTCTSDTAIPPSKLFAAKDLAEAIVAQAIALWIVGMVIQDFMKRAPEFARQLTSQLHFAASLAGSTQGVSDAPAIEYLGMDTVEAGIDNFSKKLTSSETYRKNWVTRLAPALGVTGVIAAYEAIKARQGASDTAAPDSASAANRAQLAQMLGGEAPVQTAQKITKKTAPEKKDVATMGRPLLGSNALTSQEIVTQDIQQGTPAAVMSQENASAADEQKTTPGSSETLLSGTSATLPLTPEQQYGIVHHDWDNNYAQTEETLAAVVKLKDEEDADPQKMKEALRSLEYASYAYMPAMAAVIDGLKEQSTAMDAPRVKNANVKKAMNDAVKGMELQIEVQQLLHPGKSVEQAKKMLDEARESVASAETAEGMKNAIQQLSQAQKAIA